MEPYTRAVALSGRPFACSHSRPRPSSLVEISLIPKFFLPNYALIPKSFLPNYALIPKSLQIYIILVPECGHLTYSVMKTIKTAVSFRV